MQILQVHLRGTPLGSDVNLKQLADVTEGYTGADLAAVCREVSTPPPVVCTRGVTLSPRSPAEH
jgi:hypothetical protein